MERRLAAVLTADVVGYSRLMGRDDAGTLTALRRHLDDFVAPRIRTHGGRIVKLMGDGLLAEFPSVVEAVQCAVEIQQGMTERNSEVPAETRLDFRIGVNIGDVIADGDDIYGDGVNVAARLEGLAEPGGICIRRAVRNEIRDKLPYAFEDLGAVEVKNIARPVRVFRVRFDGQQSSEPSPIRLGRFARSRLAAAGLVLACAIGGSAWIYMVTGQGGGARSWREGAVPSIAVMPFSNLSPAPENDYFADGLTDDLITDLAQISGLAVIARSSTSVYKGKVVDLREVGEELGVAYVLEGSVRRAGDAVRINAQLADAETGRQVWAERYEGTRTDLFALQDAVIGEIVKGLSVRLTAGERDRIRRIPTNNLDAYDSYLRAEASGIYTTDSSVFYQTLAHYQHAISLDPGFAEAYAGYARANAELWRLGFTQVLSGAVARKNALEAASRALELDPENARAYTVLALMQLVDKRHDEAVASARSAISLAPSDPEAHAHLAYVLAYAGEVEESRAEITTGLRLAPNPTESLRLLAGASYFTIGDNEASIQMLASANPGAPASEPGKIFLAAALGNAGHSDRARKVIEDQLSVFPNSNVRYFGLLYDFYRDPEDREAFMDSLRAAGLPEWPYGFEGNPENLVTGPELRELVTGRTWSGTLRSGLSFVQYIDRQGRWVYRSANSAIVGKGVVRDRSLCVSSESNMLGRMVCGSVYRRPGEARPSYVYVSPDTLMDFTVAE